MSGSLRCSLRGSPAQERVSGTHFQDGPSGKKRKVLRLHLGSDVWAVTPDRQVPREPVSAGPSPTALHTVLSASQGENASDSKFHPRNLALSQHRGIFFKAKPEDGANFCTSLSGDDDDHLLWMICHRPPFPLANSSSFPGRQEAQGSKRSWSSSGTKPPPADARAGAVAALLINDIALITHS